jgi:hypothetical protein
MRTHTPTIVINWKILIITGNSNQIILYNNLIINFYCIINTGKHTHIHSVQ